MALYPGAIQRLIPRHNRVAITRYRRMNLHVAVSEAASLHGYFSGADVCSHFYIRKDGTVEQYIDTKYMSKADYHGNDSTLSVETQGGLTNANSEPWTEAQIKSLAKLWAWARDTHDIPNRLATGTATVDQSLGLSWHRLGVLGWGTTVNIRYSKALKKICPGDAKIAQIPRIFTLANGASLPLAGGGKSVPIPTQEDDHMSKQDVQELKEYLHALIIGGYRSDGINFPGLSKVDIENQRRITETREMVRQIAEATGTDIDYDRVQKAAEAGVAAALENVTADVNLTVKGA